MLSRSNFGTGRGSASKEVVTQGLITMNAGDGQRAFKARLESTSSTRFAPVVSSGTDPMAFAHPRQWQPMLVDRRVPKQAVADARISRNLAGHKIEPFGSFNAYDHGDKTKDAIERDLVCVGFAAKTITYGEQTQIDGGLALVVAGSFSTTNTGNDTWVPGMLLKWSAYHMRTEDKKELLEWENTHQRNGGYTEATPRGYYPPVLEGFDFNRDVRLTMNLALKAELKAAASDPKSAPQLFNFALLHDPAEVAKLSATRLLAMRRIRADLMLFTALSEARQPNTVDDAFVTNLGLGSRANKRIDETAATALVEALQSVYGFGTELKFDNVKTVNLARDLAAAVRADGNSAYEVAVDAIAAATERVVAVSLDFTLPGAKGAICL